MRIALDFDGTIADTIRSWVNKYNEIYGTNRKYSEIELWNFHEGFQLTIPQSMDIFGMLWDNAVLEVPPIENNIGRKLERIYSAVEGMDIVTAIPKKHWKGIKEWLAHYGISYDKIVYSQHKEELDNYYDVFIDDKPDLLNNSSKPVFLRHQRWNRLEMCPYRWQTLDEIPYMLVTLGLLKPRRFERVYLGVWGSQE